MSDKYHVYRPLLDLIGHTEGTDKARGYNETLAYGAYTGGPVNLVDMTLKQVDDLQGQMLAHPKNKWNSSALGRYQIVRTTRRNIQKALSLPAASKFDMEMQDRMACFLLGQRGIDKYLSGRLSEDTLMLNLAKEWASLPKPDGGGYYSGQRSAATPAQVRAVLAHVRKRHAEGQPVKEVPIPVEKPTVPPAVEREVEKAERRNWWQWLLALPLAGVGSFFRDYPEVAWAATGGVVVLAVVALIGGRGFVRRVKDIADEVRS